MDIVKNLFPLDGAPVPKEPHNTALVLALLMIHTEIMRKIVVVSCLLLLFLSGTLLADAAYDLDTQAWDKAEAGDFKAAFLLFDQAVAADPGRETTLLDYGWELFRSGDPAKAREKTLTAYGLAKTDPLCVARLAMFSFAAGDAKGGAKWYATLALLDPPVYDVIKQIREEVQPSQELFSSSSLCASAVSAARAAMLPRHPTFDTLAALYDSGWQRIDAADKAWKEEKYDDALKNYSAVIDQWAPFGEIAVIADLCFFAGTCLDLSNRHAEGLAMLQKGFDVMDRLKLSGGENAAMGHFHAGRCCFWLGRFAEAEAHYKEAAAEYETADSLDAMAQAYDEGAMAAIDAGDLKNAAGFAMYTLKKIRTSELPVGAALANVDLAECYTLVGQGDNADRYLKAADRLAGKQENPAGTARVSLGRAMALAMSGSMDKGGPMAEEAGRILFENGEDVAALRAYLVAFYFSLGSMDLHSMVRSFGKLSPEEAAAQSEALKKARGVAEAGLAIVDRHGGTCKTGLFLTGIALSWQTENRYDTALPLWKKAVEYYQGRSSEKAEYLAALEGLARCQEGLDDWSSAADSYRRLVALHAGEPVEAAQQQLSVGRMLENAGSYAEAEKELTEALAVLSKNKDAAAAEAEYEIAKTDTAVLKTAEAEAHFAGAITRYHDAGDAGNEGMARQSFSNALVDWGRYQDALDQLQAGEKLYPESDQRFALLFASLSNIYSRIGDTEHALAAAQRSLDLCVTYGHPPGDAWLGLGKRYDEMGWHERAIDAYQKALAIAQKDANAQAEVILYNNLGSSCRALGKWDDAARYINLYAEAAKDVTNPGLTAAALNNAADLLFSIAEGTNTTATAVASVLSLYDQALALAREAGDTQMAADIQHNRAYTNMTVGRNADAIDGYRAAIASFDAMRANLKGAARRSFLSKAIYSYHYLVMTLIRDGRSLEALEALEAATGLYFSESLGDTSAPLKADALTAALRSLPADTGLLVLVPVQGKGETTAMMGIVATAATVRGQILDIDSFMEQFQSLQPQLVDDAIASTRGLSIVSKPAAPAEPTAAAPTTRDHVSFEDVVTVYRSLLSNPQSDMNQLQDMSRRLSAFLLAPWQKELAGKKQLIIIPNGVLAFLPFETLQGEDGHYLVESRDVRYVQSLRVLHYLQSRTHPANRKPLLALGGADYGFPGPEVDRVKSEDQILAVSNLAQGLLESGRDLREAYAALGIRGWPALPGTTSEVNAIAAAYRGADVVTGKAVNERSLDTRSDTGELLAYRVIHIAGHGVVVPEVPTLSALVLSQAPGDGSSMDGYLTVSEVARLRLSADFVNLSACETGLGRVYQGEGVAGLAQSFLIAGADAVSVSLWQVADASTAEYMAGLYSLAASKGSSYVAAMMEMKRRFIKDPRYRHPFFWAPFVYYGR